MRLNEYRMNTFPTWTVINGVIVVAILTIAPDWWVAVPSMTAFTYFCWTHQ